jgi:hypothetical protein
VCVGSAGERNCTVHNCLAPLKRFIIIKELFLFRGCGPTCLGYPVRLFLVDATYDAERDEGVGGKGSGFGKVCDFEPPKTKNG